jgi:hypothetical protein
MQNTDAARSLRQAASKLRDWAKHLPSSMTRGDALAFYQAITREADRLETDANAIDRQGTVAS